MKRFLFPITFSLLVLFSFGCKKKLFDSRKKYEGTWEITLTNVTTTFSTDTTGNPMTTENTYIFVQEVEISIDESNENGLIIPFGPP